MTLAQSEPRDRSIPEYDLSSNPFVFHSGLAKYVDLIGYSCCCLLLRRKNVRRSKFVHHLWTIVDFFRLGKKYISNIYPQTSPKYTPTSLLQLDWLAFCHPTGNRVAVASITCQNQWHQQVQPSKIVQLLVRHDIIILEPLGWTCIHITICMLGVGVNIFGKGVFLHMSRYENCMRTSTSTVGIII